MTEISLIKRIFVRQSTEQDCGKACLEMVFKYFGLNFSTTPAHCNLCGQLSLSDLKTLCAINGVPTRAVEMQIAFLQTLAKPSILHVVNEFGDHHFIVCFGAKTKGSKTLFLIADPASHVAYIDAQVLAGKWKSNAALYFDLNTANAASRHNRGWKHLRRFASFPIGLIPAFSILTLIAAAFGIGMSWLLQRGMNDYTLLQGTVMNVVLLLLFVVYIGRGLANFIKQYLLIRVNVDLNHSLISQLIAKLFAPSTGSPRSSVNVSSELVYIQKIQAAVSGFVAGICSDGTLIIALIAAVFYVLPVAGIIDMIILATAIMLIVRFTGNHSEMTSNVAYLSRSAEHHLKQDYLLAKNESDPLLLERMMTKHSGNFSLPMQQAEKLGTSLARMTFQLEIIQIVNLALVFFVGLQQFNKSAISYNDLMIAVILSYLLSALIPKILNALIVLYEGIDAATQLNILLGT